MRAFITFLFLISLSIHVFNQEKITFLSSDGLRLTADLYMDDIQKPFVLLFHQAESSRGEYRTIAPRLMKLGYNCLAVDLRSGDKSNYIQNESVKRAEKKNLSTNYLDAKKDIIATLEYVKRYNKKPVILFGSSYSASLTLIVAHQLPGIKAVVAFSPGEYFRPGTDVKHSLHNFYTPVFASATQLEYTYIKELLGENKHPLQIIYKPSAGRGVHGAKALWEESESSKECWFQLAFFFGKLKEL